MKSALFAALIALTLTACGQKAAETVAAPVANEAAASAVAEAASAVAVAASAVAEAASAVAAPAAK